MEEKVHQKTIKKKIYMTYGREGPSKNHKEKNVHDI